MQDLKYKVESILFVLGRAASTDELARMASVGSIGLVKQAIKDLKEDYRDRETALEIIEENEKIKLNIKKEYLHLTTNLLEETELDQPTQETLALIAYKQPVFQSTIIKVRSTTAYEHIKKLKELDFVTAEKKGRTRLLKTTPNFYHYFDVVDNTLKSKFQEVTENAEKQKTLPEEEPKE